MEVWVQGTLFDSSSEARVVRGSRRNQQMDGPRPVVRFGWSPVTRDPAVAASHAEGARLSSDIRVGLARALDRLSPELRESIRSAVSANRASAAA